MEFDPDRVLAEITRAASHLLATTAGWFTDVDARETSLLRDGRAGMCSRMSPATPTAAPGC